MTHEERGHIYDLIISDSLILYLPAGSLVTHHYLRYSPQTPVIPELLINNEFIIR